MADLQKLARDLVQREVYCGVSSLIHRLSREAAFWDELIDLGAFTRQDPADPEVTDEVYEHWVVSDWLAEQLEAHNEVIFEFEGLTIWGRCTTGQAIYVDYVIEQITRELNDV